MADQIKYKKSQIIEVLRQIEGIVVSFDRLGSAHAQMDPNLWKDAVVDYVQKSEVFRSLARCRAVLSAPFSTELGTDNMDDLEREMQSAEYWSYGEFMKARSNE